MVATKILSEYYWIQESTLGGKQRNFLWRIDEQYNLYIKRSASEKVEMFTEESLDKIHNYISENEWIDLANNVAKLGKDEEKDGLGKFIYENINKDIAYAQLASQVGAIFTSVDIWVCNGKKINIKFRIASNEWKNTITDYYSGKIIT